MNAEALIVKTGEVIPSVLEADYEANNGSTLFDYKVRFIIFNLIIKAFLASTTSYFQNGLH